MPQRIFVWDVFVRLFHWALATAFIANAFFVEDETRLHELVGYSVLGLVGARIVWGVIGSPRARFTDFPPDLAAAIGQLSEMATGRRRAHAGHSPLGALMIYNLLAVLVVIGASGWMMTLQGVHDVDWIEDLHEAAVFWAEISVALHVLAVIFESRRLGINLPRSMVTGYKTLPDE